jgi:inosose dehydratase
VLEGEGYSGWYVLEQDAVVESEPKEGEGPILDIGKSLEFVAERLNGGARR